jgi:hypothetical protein
MKSENSNFTASERLIEHRTATLDLYRRLLDIRTKVGKPIPKAVEVSHKNLDENRFLLAIVGKVKAGKSTFINALLGKDLLPSDSLQATSAIIEVFHAAKPFLRVTYANKQTEEISPNEGDADLVALTEKLREVAAIREEDRDLPIAQLNDFIIQRYNRETQQSEWEDEILALFLENELPNIHKISEADLQRRSRNYLESHRDGKAVAMRIEVGYPHTFEFDHFRIVDTPGICAKGGFAERTLDFLIKADGVIYLHSEEPAEETLHHALQNVIPERAKRHMLLVLTHKWKRSDDENEKFLAETYKCCSQIPEEHVFLVDSLTERALESFHDLKTWEEISNLRKLPSNKHKSWKKVTADAFEDADGNRAKFIELLEKQSNMRRMKREILRMSEQSMSIQIGALLGSIQELYAELAADAEARRDSYGLKLKDPQEFAGAISREIEAMDKLKADSKERLRKIGREFDLNNPEQVFGKKLKQIVEPAIDEVNGKIFYSHDTAKTADDFLTKINQDIEDSLEDLVNEIKSAFQERIVDMETSLQADFDITVPKIPLTELLEELRKAATTTVTVKVAGKSMRDRILRFITFGKYGNENKKEKQLDAERYFSSTKTSFINNLVEIKASVAESVKTKIERAREEYDNAVARKLDERKQFFGELTAKKLENDAIQKRFDEESARIKEAQLKIDECKRIRGDL